jgi:membrane protein implicated in regulation of membrane protease activity
VNVFDQLQKIKDVQDLTARIDPWLFGIAILVSLGASLAASWLYTRYYERRGTGSQINRAFPLLGISITALFICIQVSLPLSLGLLGALSIIRFRTPVKEPEEVGFIMLVIAAAIICATFNFQFLLFLYAVAAAVLWGISRFRRVSRSGRDGIILVTLGDEDAQRRQQEIEDCVGRHARRSFVESAVSQEGLASLQFSFIDFQGGLADLQAELRKVAPVTSVQIFFNRPGGIS